MPKKQRKYSITLQIKIEHVMTNTKYKHEKYCNVNEDENEHKNIDQIVILT